MDFRILFRDQWKWMNNRLATWDLRVITKRIMIFALIIALVGSYFWYTRLYMTKERRFWSAIGNSLSTRSVTRTLISGGSGNEAVQTQRFAFAPQMASESTVSFVQKSATVDTSVTTQGVQFPNAQYSRYNSFETNQANADGRVPSLDNLLGKWEQTIVAESDLEQARLNYVSELVTLVIFGNYSAEYKNELLSNFKNREIYKVDYEDAFEETVDGEEVLVYSVRVNLKGYAELLQNAFKRAGYGEFPPLNPENYREGADVSAQIVVRKRDNVIVGVNFGGREEIYSGYGIVRTVERPDATFESGELEGLVQQEIQDVL